MNEPKRKPLGKAIERTDEEWIALAQPTAQNVEDADVLFDANAPDGFGGLLDAETEEGGDLTQLVRTDFTTNGVEQ